MSYLSNTMYRTFPLANALGYAVEKVRGKNTTSNKGQNGVFGEVINYVNSNENSNSEIVKNLIASEFLIYPNPADDKVQIVYLGNENKIYSIIIYDKTGRKLIQQQGESRVTQTIFISNLFSGIYTYKITDLNNVVLQTGKLNIIR